ncbi:hypothetical protein PVAND_012213 [Polypedilum vanderplanki]|uniref:Phosphatidylinositol-glycan biosynthesis class X protein n=1 Tax=Polypedilum vanderplanki TaxID=319348 RepID=A0A9J6CM29_POLVA|nr:hypothetical protein PVAND_012213 [Polypedilum vanderplanki]
MKNLFAILLISTFAIYLNGQNLEYIEFVKNEMVSITYLKSHQPFQVYMVKINTIQGYRPGSFEKQNITDFVFISIPNHDGNKINIMPHMFVQDETRIIPSNICEQNVIINRNTKGCPIIKAEDHQMLKLSNFKLYFYNMKISVQCEEFTLLKFCEQCVVDLLPKCKVKTNRLDYVAPDSLTDNSFPNLIPIDIYVEDENHSIQLFFIGLFFIILGLIVSILIFLYFKLYNYFMKKVRDYKNDSENSVN